MYKFLVEVWREGETAQYRGFMDLETATEYADRRADALRKSGAEFSVHIYETTNY